MLQGKQIQQYIDSLLVFEVEQNTINDTEALVWRIWKILTEEKRIARRPDPEFKELILDKLRQTINAQKPVVMIDAFGGFKNYKAPTAPHVDWSEVFALNKLVKQCVKIAAVYKPGARLEFSGDSEMVTFFDNYPVDHIKTYVSEFKQLLKIFQQHVPGNVQLTYRGLAEDYNLKDLEQRITKLADELPQAEADALVGKNSAKARNNFMVGGSIDYSNATKEEFEAALRRSVILDHFYIEIDLADRHEYLEGGLHIPLIQTAIPGCIALKSVNTSKLAFWLGSGYLRQVNDSLIPYIEHGQKWQSLKGVENYKVTSPFGVLPALKSIPFVVQS